MRCFGERGDETTHVDKLQKWINGMVPQPRQQLALGNSVSGVQPSPSVARRAPTEHITSELKHQAQPASSENWASTTALMWLCTGYVPMKF